MRRGKRSRYLVATALLLVSSGLSIAAVEVLCRLVLPRPGFIPLRGNLLPGAVAPHPSRYYQLAPNFSGTITDTGFSMRVETNSLGLRDQHFERALASTWRILAVGDSFTFGTGVNAQEAWPTQLERALRSRLRSSSSIGVINAGVPGYSPVQVRDLFEELLPTVQPHVAIFGLHAGSFDRLENPYVAVRDFLVRKAQLPNVAVVEGGLLHSEMYRPWMIGLDLWLKKHSCFGAWLVDTAYRGWKAATQKSPGPELRAESGRSTEDALPKVLSELRTMRRRMDEKKGRLIIVPIAQPLKNGGLDKAHKLSNTTIGTFCRAEKIDIFDPTPILETAAQNGVPLRVSEADYHWSPAAHALFAERLAVYLIAQWTTAPKSSNDP